MNYYFVCVCVFCFFFFCFHFVVLFAIIHIIKYNFLCFEYINVNNFCVNLSLKTFFCIRSIVKMCHNWSMVLLEFSVSCWFHAIILCFGFFFVCFKFSIQIGLIQWWFTIAIFLFLNRSFDHNELADNSLSIYCTEYAYMLYFQ